MKIVTTSYINTAEYTEPLSWLDRINFHTGTLAQLAKHHEVISIEQINFTGRLLHNNVHYHFLNFRKPKLYIPTSLHRHINSLRPDVVWVHGLHFPLQVMQLRRSLHKQTKIIVQHHAEKMLTGWRKSMQKQADACINRYLFTSLEMGREWVLKGIIANEEKISEVMEASSVFNARNFPERTRSSHPIFLWVGRLDQNKDPLTVVKAFCRFLHTCSSARLYMIFQEDKLLPEVRNLIAQEGQSENIQLVGKVPHNKLETWYQKADFFLSGSHYEGSGIAVCEAMSCGCIPILTSIPSFSKMTCMGTCGLLYSPGNAEELYACLKAALELNIEKERAKVLKHFKNELSFEAIAGKINEVLLKSAEI
jgi:glycosyltransferase involved in cell wall biosynthesis